MDDQRFRQYDLTIKIVTSVLTVATIIIGVSQYIHNNEREFRKELYDRQIELYMETSELVSKLANFPKDQMRTPEYEALRRRFFELQYGKLYLLQDTTVERACLEFSNRLITYERDPRISQEEMQLLSLALNQACRKSIQNTWDIQLPVLNRAKDDLIR